MKNILLALNIVLVLAVATLFYLHFSGSKKTTTTSQVADTQPAGSFKIAYFDMDSIEANYDYLKDVRNELKGKEQSLTNQLNQLRSRYMDKVNKYKQEAQTMTQERQSVIENELMNEQKMLGNKEQSMGIELQDASFKKMQDVNRTIESFLKEYNKDKGYSYILAHQPGQIYYKDPRFDITSDLVKGLNDSYKSKK
jgi:outer membrane protein